MPVWGLVRTLLGVRVVIDFVGSESHAWKGEILTSSESGDPAAAPVPFDGRLQLLRLLEAAVDPSTASPDKETP